MSLPIKKHIYIYNTTQCKRITKIVMTWQNWLGNSNEVTAVVFGQHMNTVNARISAKQKI